MSGLDGRLAPTFAAQLALITRQQVLAAGGSPAAVGRRLDNGRWEIAERGVYALRGVPWTWRRSLAALVLSVTGSRASHRAAAALLGAALDDRAVAPFELSVGNGIKPGRHFTRTRHRSPDVPIVIHQQLDHAAAEVWHIDGIAVTAPLRVALDIGAVLDFDRYRQVIGVLRREHGLTWASLDAVYRRHSIQGRDGCGALRDLLERHFGAEGAPDEVVEARCADLLVAGGLPEPVHQYEIVRPDGRRARFDLAYPEWRIGIETDGRIHSDEDVRQRDLRRTNQLQLLGWTIFRFTWEDVMYRPDDVVATIAAALAVSAQ